MSQHVGVSYILWNKENSLDYTYLFWLKKRKSDNLTIPAVETLETNLN